METSSTVFSISSLFSVICPMNFVEFSTDNFPSTICNDLYSPIKTFIAHKKKKTFVSTYQTDRFHHTSMKAFSRFCWWFALHRKFAHIGFGNLLLILATASHFFGFLAGLCIHIGLSLCRNSWLDWIEFTVQSMELPYLCTCQRHDTENKTENYGKTVHFDLIQQRRTIKWFTLVHFQRNTASKWDIDMSFKYHMSMSANTFWGHSNNCAYNYFCAFLKY